MDPILQSGDNSSVTLSDRTKCISAFGLQCAACGACPPALLLGLFQSGFNGVLQEGMLHFLPFAG